MTIQSRAPLAVFLGLTFALSAAFWWLIAAAGSIGAQGSAYLLAAATALRELSHQPL